MKNVACFDIGGTFIKYGIVNENGNILYKNKFETPKFNCRHTIPMILSQKVDELSEIFPLECIGISTAGQVDSKKGEITFASENIPDYTGTKLSEEMHRLTGLVCNAENDVNCAALGELWKGAIDNNSSFFFLTLGTGIGGAIIIDRKLWRGTRGSAGEAGHMVINEYGNACTCGGIGCFESYASVSALIKNYCIATNMSFNTVDGEKVMKLVNTHDEVAISIYNKFIDHIVTGIINITYLLDPGLIIIGGGISEQGGLIMDINKRFKKRAMPSYTGHTKIISSSLKNDAGLIGACYVGLSNNTPV